MVGTGRSSAQVGGGMLRVGASVFALQHVSGSKLARVSVDRGMVASVVVRIAAVALGVPAFLLSLGPLWELVSSGSLRRDVPVYVLAATLDVLFLLVIRKPLRWRLRILWADGQTAIDLFDRRRAPLEELQRQVDKAASDLTYRGPVVTIGDVIVGNQIDSGGGSVQMGGSGNQAGPPTSAHATSDTRGMAMGDHIQDNTISGNGGIVQVGGHGNVARISNTAPTQVPVAIEAIRALAALVPAPTKEQLESAAQEAEQADPANKAGMAVILSKALGVIGTVSGTVTQAAGAASAVAAAIKALGF